MSEPWYRRIFRKKARGDIGSSYSKNNESSNAHEIVGALNAIREQLVRGNEENTPEKKRERCWRHAEVVGLWLAAFVGIGAVVIASLDAKKERGVMEAQQTVMQGQIKEMRDEQRPWIDITDVQPAGELSYQFNNVHLGGLTISLKNTGHLPALHIAAAYTLESASIPILFEFPKPGLLMDGACRMASQTRKIAEGAALFPDRPVEVKLDQVSFYTPNLKEGELRNIRLAVCIDYEIPGSQEHGHTAAEYVLQHIQNTEEIAGFDPKIGPIPAKNLRLSAGSVMAQRAD